MATPVRATSAMFRVTSVKSWTLAVELPRYADLNLLLAVAMKAAKHASMAIEGLNTEFDDRAGIYRKNAEGYAYCVVDGLTQATLQREDGELK